MITAFRSYNPLRLVLATTLLLSIVLPVVHIACSLDAEAFPRKPHEAAVSEQGAAGFADCFRMAAMFALSAHDGDRCQHEGSWSSLQTCDIGPLETPKVVPAPPTEKLSQFLVAQLSPLLDLAGGHLSELLTAAPFSREADLSASRQFVSLRVLFSSFLI